MDDFVSKPLRRETLIAALNRWVGVSAALPTLPVLDRDGLRELQEVAGEQWGALVDDFLADLPVQLVALTTCQDDPAVLARVAHVVKGSSSTMSAVRLAAAAEALEAAALSGVDTADALRLVEQRAVEAAAALAASATVAAGG